MRAILFWLCVALAAVGLLVGPQLVFTWAPVDEQLYFNQKIFYYHVPLAQMMLVGVFVAGIASVMWLRTRKQAWDDVAWAAADIVVLFGLAALATGVIWAKIAWGRWWVWDARLTNTLLLWMIFLAYALVRRYGGPGSERLGAGMAIFGMVDVPLVYFAVNLWKTLHPTNRVVPGLRGPMALTFLATAVTFLLVYVVVLRAWVAVRRGERRLHEVTDLALENGRNRMMRTLVCLFLLGALAGPARAQDECLKQIAPRYELDRETGDTPRAAGDRFLADLGKASPGVVANVKDAARYELQQEAADSFARNQKFVLWAYGLAWLVPLGFAAYVWSRQRRLAAALDDLERKLGAAR